MMILATGSRQVLLRSRSSAFTLVELVIVLSVLAILALTAVPAIDGILNERQAREPVNVLLAMARDVRNRALAEQRPYQIAFDAEGFRASRYFNPYGGKEEFDQLQDLLKVQQEQMKIIEASRERGISLEDQRANIRMQSALSGMNFSTSYKVPDELDYKVRFWRDTEWIEMEGGEFRRWVFQPSGMCDPMKIQFQSDNAFFEVEFHPLTADIKDETSWVE